RRFGQWGVVQVEQCEFVSGHGRQAAAGGSDQDSVVDAHRDVAGAAVAQSAVGHRTGRGDQCGSGGFFGPVVVFATHCWTPQSWSGSVARVNMATSPKLPDFSSSARRRSPRVYIHGTPGETSPPTAAPCTSSACTMAPDVSPPAHTTRRTPRPTSPFA